MDAPQPTPAPRYRVIGPAQRPAAPFPRYLWWIAAAAATCALGARAIGSSGPGALARRRICPGLAVRRDHRNMGGTAGLPARGGARPSGAYRPGTDRAAARGAGRLARHRRAGTTAGRRIHNRLGKRRLARFCPVLSGRLLRQPGRPPDRRTRIWRVQGFPRPYRRRHHGIAVGRGRDHRLARPGDRERRLAGTPGDPGRRVHWPGGIAGHGALARRQGHRHRVRPTAAGVRRGPGGGAADAPERPVQGRRCHHRARRAPGAGHPGTRRR